MQSIDEQGDDVQGGGVQRVAVFSLGELRPQPSWCEGGSRMMDIRGVEEKATEGTALVRADLGPRGGGETRLARQVGRRSCEAKAAVRRDELGGASMQPNTAVLQGATRVCRPCFSGTRA
jgi:hypothetical protein